MSSGVKPKHARHQRRQSRSGVRQGREWTVGPFSVFTGDLEPHHMARRRTVLQRHVVVRADLAGVMREHQVVLCLAEATQRGCFGTRRPRRWWRRWWWRRRWRWRPSAWDCGAVPRHGSARHLRHWEAPLDRFRHHQRRELPVCVWYRRSQRQHHTNELHRLIS